METRKFTSEETEKLVEEKAARFFETLSEDIKKGIGRLREEAPGSELTSWINRQVVLGNEQKLKDLQTLMNKMGYDIGSLVAIEKDKQEEAVRYLEECFNPYFNEKEKQEAREELKSILG